MRIQDIIPVQIRKYLLKRHQDWLWQRTIKKYKYIIEEGKTPSRDLIRKLVYAWGNQGFSAQTDYLESCINYTLNSNGLIVECGSGLTSILIGFIAKKQGRKIISFEHIDYWAQKIKGELERNNLTNNILLSRELVNYGNYDWYNVNEINIGMVGLCICDAPPGNTLGGRRGFFNIFRNQLQSDSIILLDDANREDEQIMIKEWQRVMQMNVLFIGESHLHAIIKII